MKTNTAGLIDPSANPDVTNIPSTPITASQTRPLDSAKPWHTPALQRLRVSMDTCNGVGSGGDGGHVSNC